MSFRLPLVDAILDFGARLRFPQLFLLTAALFVVDLLIPDLVPFADEIILGLIALLLGSLKKRAAAGVPVDQKPPPH